MLHAIVVVVIVSTRAKLHFLDGDRDLFLFRLVGLLFRLVLELAEIDDLTDGRLSRRRHFHQIKPFLFGPANGVADIQYAECFAVVTDDAHFRYANSLIDSYGREPATVWTRAATSKACSYAAPPF